MHSEHRASGDKYYMLTQGVDFALYLGSSGHYTTVGNSDCKSFLATELMLGGMIMRSVHNG